MSEVMDQAVIGMPYEMALGCEVSRRQYYSRANAVLAERDALAAKLAMLEDAAAKGDAARQQCGGMEMEIEELRAELAELRSRVAVVPDGYALVPVEPTREMFIAINKEDDKAYAGGCHHGAQFEWLWAAAIEAAPRPNGLTVSEGLVQGMAKFAQEIICGALDGGSFDGADIQESAERHGLIAKQVMNEPCRDPEEYCACAWSTSFPAECYRVTPKLRALLNEDKENGNG